MQSVYADFCAYGDLCDWWITTLRFYKNLNLCDCAGSISNIDDAEYLCNASARALRKVISGVVGAASSVTSVQVANLLRLFRIPQVSLQALATLQPSVFLSSFFLYSYETIDNIWVRGFFHASANGPRCLGLNIHRKNMVNTCIVELIEGASLRCLIDDSFPTGESSF